jgi:hypothetical protein
MLIPDFFDRQNYLEDAFRGLEDRKVVALILRHLREKAGTCLPILKSELEAQSAQVVPIRPKPQAA